MNELKSKPVIIIGAPRSGTNMLRDVLSALPGFHTWPCDEIPYLWRHGNKAHPHDEFTPEMATPQICAFMRQEFIRETPPNTSFLVEKTCANSLRPGFLAKIFPEAVFIYIVRNGLDTSSSAMKRWRSKFDLRYSLSKAKYVPLSDVPYYSWRVLKNRVQRALSKEKRLSVWGPIYSGMGNAASELSLPALAATQWVKCMEQSDSQLDKLPSNIVHTLKYENFVAEPTKNLKDILTFLGIELSDLQISVAVHNVHSGNVGKSSTNLLKGELEEIKRIVKPKLTAHGYTIK